jgi:High-affinity nickel-transport protein
MCLLDTIDGALMLALYTSTSLARGAIAVLYYSIVLTGFTVLVAIVIGVIQLLTLIDNVASPSGEFWEGVGRAGDSYDIIGDLLPSHCLATRTDHPRRLHLWFICAHWSLERDLLPSVEAQGRCASGVACRRVPSRWVRRREEIGGRHSC